MGSLFLLLAQNAPEASNPFTTLLQTEKFIPAIAIVGGLSLAGVWMMMHYFYSWIELCKNNEIKLRMIEAGHSASEIERVIWAGKTVDDDDGEEKPAKKVLREGRIPSAKPIPQHIA
jgi:hypothetical protein